MKTSITFPGWRSLFDRRALTVSVILAVMTMISGGKAKAASPPAVGSLAPLIEGQDQNDATWKLADAAGKKNVLLYFYPKDGTPGCTTEACGLRDRMGDLNRDNVTVVGVSFDSAESHRKFIADQKLNFTLLADTNGKIADAYGARREAGANIARRISFLIGKDGRIVHVTDDPKAQTHLDEMKAAVAKLGAK